VFVGQRQIGSATHRPEERLRHHEPLARRAAQRRDQESGLSRLILERPVDPREAENRHALHADVWPGHPDVAVRPERHLARAELPDCSRLIARRDHATLRLELAGLELPEQTRTNVERARGHADGVVHLESGIVYVAPHRRAVQQQSALLERDVARRFESAFLDVDADLVGQQAQPTSGVRDVDVADHVPEGTLDTNFLRRRCRRRHPYPDQADGSQRAQAV